MITLIWNNIVYVVPGNYYSARKLLNVPDNDITPWAWFHEGLSWTSRFMKG